MLHFCHSASFHFMAKVQLKTTVYRGVTYENITI